MNPIRISGDVSYHSGQIRFSRVSKAESSEDNLTLQNGQCYASTLSCGNEIVTLVELTESIATRSCSTPIYPNNGVHCIWINFRYLCLVSHLVNSGKCNASSLLYGHLSRPWELSSS